MTVSRFVSTSITDPVHQLAEGPVWLAGSDEVAWVDVPSGLLSTATWTGTALESVRTVLRVDTPLGAALPAAGGGWLLASGTAFLRAGTDGSIQTLAAPADHSVVPVRMNDAGCDPRGRVLGGTMAYDSTPGAGCLYRLDPDGSTEVVLGDVSLSNGLGWSRDGATLFYVDSPTGRVDAFDYDLPMGRLSRRREFAAIPTELGTPDGLAVDTRGRVWVAVWGGGEVRCYGKSGLEAIVEVAAPQVTSCCFVGTELDVLVITTARQGLSKEQLVAHPASGALFAVSVDAIGVPTTSFNG